MVKAKGQEMDRVRLSASELRLELSPSIGGRLSAFEWVDQGSARPILRKCQTPLEKVLDAASFPLVPYVNRIRGGCFTFRGREVQIAPNMPGDSSPLHGQGWLNRWTVEESDDTSATLIFRHEPGEWPWHYQAWQHFSLYEQGLVLTLTCWNESRDPMPCGLGLHPYFPCGPETRLDTRVT